MTLHIDDEILASWKALNNPGSGTGWQAVPVTSPGDCRIMAARHFPENDEAVLIGFTPVALRYFLPWSGMF